jgi:hypothetical protein
VSSAPARRRGAGSAIIAGVAALLIAAAAFAAGWRLGGEREIKLRLSPARDAIAFVLDTPCFDGPCLSLWVGPTERSARKVETLHAGSEWCEEISWTPDGGRVAFLINGYQLRIFDAHTGANLGALNLIEPDKAPSSRVARGVTFSTNGAAVTFDDCPREHSGCRAGLIAIPHP